MEELVAKLKGRLRFLDPGSVDRRLMREAADALELGSGEVTAAGVVGWCEENGVSLLPWQRKKLGLDE